MYSDRRILYTRMNSDTEAPALRTTPPSSEQPTQHPVPRAFLTIPSKASSYSPPPAENQENMEFPTPKPPATAENQKNMDIPTPKPPATTKSPPQDEWTGMRGESSFRIVVLPQLSNLSKCKEGCRTREREKVTITRKDVEISIDIDIEIERQMEYDSNDWYYYWTEDYCVNTLWQIDRHSWQPPLDTILVELAKMVDEKRLTQDECDWVCGLVKTKKRSSFKHFPYRQTVDPSKYDVRILTSI
jgi:hypothetical protein